MARARERSEWDRSAVLRAFLAGLVSGDEYDPAEFHPMRTDELPGIGALKPKDA